MFLFTTSFLTLFWVYRQCQRSKSHCYSDSHRGSIPKECLSPHTREDRFEQDGTSWARTGSKTGTGTGLSAGTWRYPSWIKYSSMQSMTGSLRKAYADIGVRPSWLLYFSSVGCGIVIRELLSPAALRMSQSSLIVCVAVTAVECDAQHWTHNHD